MADGGFADEISALWILIQIVEPFAGEIGIYRAEFAAFVAAVDGAVRADRRGSQRVAADHEIFAKQFSI